MPMGQYHSGTKLVESTLKAYHILEKFQHCLQDYFSHFKMCFTSGTFTTNWQQLEVALSPVILFAAAMNLLVKSVEKPSNRL